MSREPRGAGCEAHACTRAVPRTRGRSSGLYRCTGSEAPTPGGFGRPEGAPDTPPWPSVIKITDVYQPKSHHCERTRSTAASLLPRNGPPPQRAVSFKRCPPGASRAARPRQMPGRAEVDARPRRSPARSAHSTGQAPHAPTLAARKRATPCASTTNASIDLKSPLRPRRSRTACRRSPP
jgi:hypothetical protein